MTDRKPKPLPIFEKNTPLTKLLELGTRLTPYHELSTVQPFPIIKHLPIFDAIELSKNLESNRLKFDPICTKASSDKRNQEKIIGLLERIVQSDTPIQSAVKGMGDAGADSHATKPRKKLKPLERETNEGLLLLYEIFNYYKVEYMDELTAHKAWGKIISKEFTSDLIGSIAVTNKHILLSGGEKLFKTDFSDKYRRRFD